jgi:DNA-binding Lrp family transcriptional regulator
MGKAGLQESHLKALKLLSEARLSISEIAKSVGLSQPTLSNLMAGNVKAAGSVALDFKTEYQKVLSKQTEESVKLLKENKSLALTKLNQRLRNIMAKKPTKDMTAEVAQILNALAKVDSQGKIEGGIHTHYHLTAEERVNEFRRLVAATAKDVGSRIHGSVGRGSAAAPKPIGSRGRGQEA